MMKTLSLVLGFMLAGFNSFPFLQAQQAAAVDHTYQQQAKTNRAEHPVKKQAAFDLSLGQQAASFEDLETYVADHLSYPEIAWEYGIEGTVRILFTVSPEGEIRRARVVDRLGYGCDKAALELVRKMPRWKPASNYGVPVKSRQVLQLNFSLQ